MISFAILLHNPVPALCKKEGLLFVVGQSSRVIIAWKDLFPLQLWRHPSATIRKLEPGTIKADTARGTIR